jgi:hypothetical protein
MIYERVDAHNPLDLSPLPMGIDPSILNVDVSMSWCGRSLLCPPASTQ